jgi:long-chain fatty acid transport protein
LGGAFVPSKTRADIRPISLPPVINAGVYWQVNPKWGIEVDYEHVRWSEFKTLKAAFSPPPNFVPFGLPLTAFNLPQDWKDTNTLRLGASYQINETWELRGGLGLDETAIPSRTLNPVIFGADALTLNTGASFKWKSFIVDLGYQAAFYKTRKVNNSELEGLPATGVPYLGAPGADKHKAFVNFVMLSVGYRY